MRLIGQGKAHDVRSSSILFEKGDVLYGKMRPYLNKVWLAEFAGICSAEFLVFPQSGGLNNAFLALRLNADDFVDFANKRVSGDRPRVDFKTLSSFVVNLPPLSEQERIAKALIASLKRLQASESAAQRGSKRLSQYRNSVLRAAVAGELTLDWRKHNRPRESGRKLLERLRETRRIRWEELELQRLISVGKTPKNDKWKSRYQEAIAPEPSQVIGLPRGWVLASLDQCFRVERGKFSVRPRNDPAYFDGPHPFVQIGNLPREGGLITEYTQTLNDKGLLVSKKFPTGTILIAIVGATIGNTGVLSFAACCPDSLVAVRSDDETLRDYADVWLRANKFKLRAAAVASGGQPNINLGILLPFPIALPPLDEQAQVVLEANRRLSASDELNGTIESQVGRAREMRQSFLREAFAGKLVPQDPNDAPASVLLDLIRKERSELAKSQRPRRKTGQRREGRSAMKATQDPINALKSALAQTHGIPTAMDLFMAGEFKREDVYDFYDAIADFPEAVKRLSKDGGRSRKRRKRRAVATKPIHPFRLHELWVKRFKNLEDYLVKFDRQHALDVLLGWNGTGKSNLFEVLIVIFRDLHHWQVKDKWRPQNGLEGYRIRYEIGGRLVEVAWDLTLRRPQTELGRVRSKATLQKCRREDLPLPHFVFGYYSGPSNRFAELFSEPKQDHYDRLLKQKADDEVTLARLLEERRFFNAETHHAKYALLAFFYEDDLGIRNFLQKHLRIEALESVLFVLKRPRWHRNNDPEDFWGADGLLRPVLERLRRHSVGSMVLPQRVDDGFQEGTRDHYFLLLPDISHVQGLAAEYANPTSFFVALESADFSSIIHEVRIRVRIKATATKQTVITFKEMSEGEQQLLMVLGLLRFTKMNQSLVLLDEPDTHLNPHWQLGYLYLLLDALVGKASDRRSSKRPPIEKLEQRLSSQVLLSTHDPLAVAGLLKENIHLLKRREQTEECVSLPATEDPRGMGFTGILTSEMFGLKSDLDEETLWLLDQHADLAGKKTLTAKDRKKLTSLTLDMDRLGFKSASSDPYYRAYLQSLSGRRKAQEIFSKETWTKSDIQTLRKETDEILEEIHQEDERQ
jgi:restriction endonuclease S subunit